MDRNYGLKCIVFYDRLIGNTHFGWNFGQKLSKRKRCLLIIWNLVFLSLVSIHCYIGLKNSFLNSDTEFDLNNYRPDASKHTKILPLILFSVGFVTYTVQTLSIGIFLVLRGPNILDIINTEDIIKVDPKYEKKIGIILVVIRFILTTAFITTIGIVMYDNYAVSESRFSNLIILMSLLYFLSVNTQLIVTSLILYKSLIISKQFESLSEMEDLSTIFDNICKVNQTIERFDSLISGYTLFKLAMNTLVCISFSCMLSIVPEENPTNSVSHVVTSFLLIFVLCLVCDIIPKRFHKLLKKLKTKFEANTRSKSLCERVYSHVIMIRMNEIKSEMYFTAFGLFRVNTNTLLSSMALIISYSIIIIQTTVQSPR